MGGVITQGAEQARAALFVGCLLGVVRLAAMADEFIRHARQDHHRLRQRGGRQHQIREHGQQCQPCP